MLKLLLILLLIPSVALADVDAFLGVSTDNLGEILGQAVAGGASCETVAQSATGAAAGYNLARNSSYAYWSSEITISDGPHTVCAITLELLCVDGGAGITGDLILYVYGDGTGEPGSLAAGDSTSDAVAASTVGTGGYAEYTFTGLNVTLSDSGTYYLVLHKTVVDNEEYIRWGYILTTSPENMDYSSDASSWTDDANGTRAAAYKLLTQ